ncbi:MAG: 5-methyltetrahydropteroyltriglutamate--homocysteine S-methyltransferase [Gemmatimonadota bacterium]
MASANNLGFSRIGARRELKRALESYWAGNSDAAALQETAQALRLRHWQLQRNRDITGIPSNDFSLYDQVLDTTVLLGAVPARYQPLVSDPLACYFAMARGHQAGGVDVPAMEMTKWFDTNYHYIVPELSRTMQLQPVVHKLCDEYREAKALGIETRPVLLGPISWLLLGKMQQGGSALELLPRILPGYVEVLEELQKAGARWVQFDEPVLVTDLSAEARAAFLPAYTQLRVASGSARLLLATYFGRLADNLDVAAALPIDALHVDLVRAPEQLSAVARALPGACVLSAGVVDGRNVWRTDLDRALHQLRDIADARGAENIWVSPSCSLLHVPVDLAMETALDAETRGWLAFGAQKLAEVSALAAALDSGETNTQAFQESRAAVTSRSTSARVHDPAVTRRLAVLTPELRHRVSPYADRRIAQGSIGLPLLPTTTIGSLPQTTAVRNARAEFKAGKHSAEEYDRFLRQEIEQGIRAQEALGLDVLVHGEFERNDMVEYFGEQLSGFVFTSNGWVQSYGSRCVKPPIIMGDVSRPAAMTVDWSHYAQSLTAKPVKGMLTGPVTILQWSFVRIDQPRRVTCAQIALAIRDEVHDLEQAGLRIIQIDEPAIREGLPLRRADWAEYLGWAVASFRLATSVVKDATQIHTHMCYSEFNDIIDAVAALDADVVSMETSRSKMELLQAFADFKYPNGIGPGVYDIHSPRVPSDEEIMHLLRRAITVLDAHQIWVNPDCGLKTRQWPEVTRSLEAMVRAAQRLRTELSHGSEVVSV